MSTAVAVHLVRLGLCSGIDIAWLREQGARWHPLIGGISLPRAAGATISIGAPCTDGAR